MNKHWMMLLGLALAGLAGPAAAQDWNNPNSYEVPNGVYRCEYADTNQVGHSTVTTVTIDDRWRHSVGRKLREGAYEQYIYKYVDGLDYMMSDLQAPVVPIPVLRRGRCSPVTAASQ